MKQGQEPKRIGATVNTVRSSMKAW